MQHVSFTVVECSQQELFQCCPNVHKHNVEDLTFVIHVVLTLHAPNSMCTDHCLSGTGITRRSPFIWNVHHPSHVLHVPNSEVRFFALFNPMVDMNSRNSVRSRCNTVVCSLSFSDSSVFESGDAGHAIWQTGGKRTKSYNAWTEIKCTINTGRDIRTNCTMGRARHIHANSPSSSPWHPSGPSFHCSTVRYSILPIPRWPWFWTPLILEEGGGTPSATAEIHPSTC